MQDFKFTWSIASMYLTCMFTETLTALLVVTKAVMRTVMQVTPIALSYSWLLTETNPSVTKYSKAASRDFSKHTKECVDNEGTLYFYTHHLLFQVSTSSSNGYLPKYRSKVSCITMSSYSFNNMPYYLELQSVSYKFLVSFSGRSKVQCNKIKHTV